MVKPTVKFTNLSEDNRINWLGTRITDPKVTIPGGVRLIDTGIVATDGRKYVKSGTVLFRTSAEKTANTGYKVLLADTVLAPTDEVCILLHDVWDLGSEAGAFDIVDAIAPKSGNVVYENYLPQQATFTTEQRDRIRQDYVVRRGLL